MFTNLRKALGRQYAKWHFRKTEEPVQEFTEFFRSAKSFLVVLPLGYEGAQSADASFKKLFDVLKKAHLTIVTSGVRGTVLDDMRRSEVIRLDEADISSFFLPRKSALERISARSYDVALDLNLDFVLHAAYICRASRAPIRVGALCPGGEYFYNVHVNLKRSEQPGQMYNEFVRCLEMF
jgi:hypothetical protein